MLLDRIKKRAKKYDMNLQDVASATNISQNTIYGWRTKTPRMDKLQAVADVLHTTTDYLNGSTDDPEIPQSTKKSSQLTWKDLGMSYEGDVPDDFKNMIDSLAEGYFKSHPEMIDPKYRDEK